MYGETMASYVIRVSYIWMKRFYHVFNRSRSVNRSRSIIRIQQYRKPVSSNESYFHFWGFISTGTYYSEKLILISAISYSELQPKWGLLSASITAGVDDPSRFWFNFRAKDQRGNSMHKILWSFRENEVSKTMKKPLMRFSKMLRGL